VGRISNLPAFIADETFHRYKNELQLSCILVRVYAFFNGMKRFINTRDRNIHRFPLSSTKGIRSPRKSGFSSPMVPLLLSCRDLHFCFAAEFLAELKNIYQRFVPKNKTRSMLPGLGGSAGL